MVKENKMKQTEIGLIPEDWEVVKIGESFTFKNGLNKEKEFFGYGFPIVNYMDVYKNTFINSRNFKGKVFVSNQELKSFEVRLGDVLFTRTSETQEEIGYSAVIIEDLKNTVFSGFILRARPFNSKFNFEFCRYCFSNSQVRVQVISNATYTTRALTNGRVLSEIHIPLPSLSEQEAIATALSDCDAWIDSFEQVLAKKRLIKQGAMQELLTPKEDWEVKTLGDVCDVRDGTHDSPKYYAKGIRFITSKNIVNNKLDFKEVNFISPEEAVDINKRSKVDKNDILMSMIGTIGNAVLIDYEPDFCIKNIALIKPKKISERFLIQMIKSTKFQDLLKSKMDGGIQKFVSLGVLRNLDFSIPKSFSKQTRIATILSDMDIEIGALEQKLNKARQIKQGMMQDLLTGRIRLIE